MNAFQHLTNIQMEFFAGNKSDLHNRLSQVYCLGDKEAYHQAYEALSYAIESKCNITGLDQISCFYQASRGIPRFEAKLLQLFAERYEHNPITYQKVLQRALKEAKALNLKEKAPDRINITCNDLFVGNATSMEVSAARNEHPIVKLKKVKFSKRELLTSGVNNIFNQRLPFNIFTGRREIRNAWVIDAVDLLDDNNCLTCELLNLEAEAIFYR